MDIDKIRYFCTIAQSGSLTEASKLLNISQPALSKAVKQLELHFGEKLLMQSGRGIALTDLGKRVARESLPVVEKFDNLILLREKSEILGLKIATFEVFSTYFLGKVISEDFSEYLVDIFELIPGKIEEAIIEGKADIGISYLPIPNPELDILKVTTIKMGVFGSSKHSHESYEDLDFVVPNSPIHGNPTKVKGLDGWPDHLIPRRVKYRVTMMESALDLCRRGKAIGYFPQFVIDLHNQLTLSQYHLTSLSTPKAVRDKKQDIYLIKRKSDPETSEFKKMAKYLRKLK